MSDSKNLFRFIGLLFILIGYQNCGSGFSSQVQEINQSSESSNRLPGNSMESATIEGLVLVDTDSGQDVRMLQSVDTIDLNSLDHGITIRANLSNDTAATTVRIDGVEITNDSDQWQSLSGKDSDGTFLPYDFTVGTFEIQFIPSTLIDGETIQGEPYSIMLTIEDSMPNPIPPGPMPPEEPAPTPVPPAPTPMPPTPETPATLVLNRDFGYANYTTAQRKSNEVIDAYNSTWIVANSKNANPTSGNPCTSGNLPINLYPVNIRYHNDLIFRGGRFLNQIPQNSPWAPSYCNSAALIFRNSNNVQAENIRVEGAWDAIRFAQSSNNFSIRGMWATDWRDDALENDQIKSGKVLDSLFDGGFAGISWDPGGSGGPSDSNNYLVELDHFNQRLKKYLFRGAITHGQLFKGTSYSTRVTIRHSVFAVEDESPFMSNTRLSSVLNKVDGCENNYLLYTGAGTIPAAYTGPLNQLNQRYPGCFKFYSGAQARQIWERVKQNWINCHPRVPRSNSDPNSDTGQCDPQLVDKGL